MHGNVKNIAGQRFGRLTVLAPAANQDGYARWSCRCDCGHLIVARGHTLRDGRTKSCGCLSKETTGSRATRHGATKGRRTTPEYRSYQKMKERCLNPSHLYYQNYGGRGITICPRWLARFEDFLSDMGPRPAGMTLDRIDGNKGYEPGNCRWATRKQQNQNARHVRPVVRSDGRSYPSVGAAAEDVGGCANTIRDACRNPSKIWKGFTWRYAADDLKRNAKEAVR